MAYDSRTDRKTTTWEKKSTRGRKFQEQQRDSRKWESSKRASRWDA